MPDANNSRSSTLYFMYLIFYMVGLMIAIMIIMTTGMSASYAWIPLLVSILLVTVMIIALAPQEVSLRTAAIAAISSIVLIFVGAYFGAVSGALLAFQGIATAFGLASAGIGGLIASLTALSAGAWAAVLGGGVVADPGAAMDAVRAAGIPLPGGNEDWGEEGLEWDAPPAPRGGKRRYRGGNRRMWKW
jgi:hypothetical protein